jgi:MFS family permease
MTLVQSSPTSAPATAPVITDSFYSWQRLFYSVLIGVVSNASLWTSVALMPSLQRDFALTRTESSYPYIAIVLGFLFGSPALGRWSDRYGITRVLIGASAVGSLAYVAGGMAHNFWLFLLSQIFVGLGTAVGFAPLTSDISHWFRQRRGLAVTIVSSAVYLSGVLWTTIIADVLQDGSWRDVHMIIGAGLLTIMPLSLLLRRRVPIYLLDEADRYSAQNAKDVGIPPFAIKLILAIAGISCCIAMAMPQIHIVALCLDLGLTLSQGNEMLLIILIGAIVSRILSGAIIDKVGAVRILLIGSMLQMLALCLYIPFDGLASLYVVSLIFGLAQGGILPSYPLIVREYLPARSAGAAIGFVSTSTQFGMAFGGWLSGWIFDQTGSYFIAFINGIGWNLINITLISLFLLRISNRSIQQDAHLGILRPEQAKGDMIQSSTTR